MSSNQDPGEKPSTERMAFASKNPKDILRSDLLSLCGANYADAIDSLVNKHAEYLLNQGKPYEDVLKYLYGMIKEVEQAKGYSDQANDQTEGIAPAVTSEEGSPQRENAKSIDKRSVPIRPKEKVYDEWAAVLRHQDEVTKETELREKMIYKERQKLYRQELEVQKAELETRAKQNIQSGSSVEKDALNKYNELIKQAEEVQKYKQGEKKAKAASIMEENLKEKKRTEQISKEREVIENQIMLEGFKRQIEEEEQKVQEEKNVRVKLTTALRQSYAVQEELKRQQRMQDRQLDKAFLAKEEERGEAEEKNRQRYFENLKEKQRATVEKEKLFQNYGHAGREELLKNDEVKQIKHFNEILKKEEEETQKITESKTREKALNKVALTKQMNYKQNVKAMQKDEEKEYLEKIKLRDREIEEREQRKQDEIKRKQQEYSMMLQNQIKDTQQRRLYKHVMTDHERKVNAQDIEAYENMDTQLHSKVIGVKPANEINLRPSPVRAYKASRDGSAGSKDQRLNSNDRVIPGIQQNSYQLQLAKQLNPDALYKPKQIYTISPQKLPSKLAEIAAKNMDDPNLMIMRSNTQNTSYGYRPPPSYKPPDEFSTVSQPPHKYMVNTVDTRNPPNNQGSNGRLANKSFEVRTIEEPQQNHQFKKQPNTNSNKSFIYPYPPRENPLLDAGKELVKNEENMMKEMEMDSRRGSSMDAPNQRRKPYNDYKPVEVTRMIPAGASRRQAINYNIISGANKQ